MEVNLRRAARLARSAGLGEGFMVSSVCCDFFCFGSFVVVPLCWMVAEVVWIWLWNWSEVGTRGDICGALNYVG